MSGSESTQSDDILSPKVYQTFDKSKMAAKEAMLLYKASRENSSVSSTEYLLSTERKPRKMKELRPVVRKQSRS
jgi:hypothetical protein